MIIKPLAYLSGITLLASVAVWVRMAIRSAFRSADGDGGPFFFILMLSVFWLGGAGYIIRSHFKYKTEYDFQRKEWTWEELRSRMWRLEIIRWSVILVVALIGITVAVIKYKSTH